MSKKPLLLLCIVLLFAACDKEDMNMLIGTWEDSGTNSNGDWKDQFIFTENNEVTRIYDGFSVRVDDYGTKINPLNETDNGTYTCNNSIIYIKWQSSNFSPPNGTPLEFPIEISYNYSIKGNELFITFPDDRGTYSYKRVK